MRPQRGGGDLNVTAGNGHDNAAHRSSHWPPSSISSQLPSSSHVLRLLIRELVLSIFGKCNGCHHLLSLAVRIDDGRARTASAAMGKVPSVADATARDFNTPLGFSSKPLGPQPVLASASDDELLLVLTFSAMLDRISHLSIVLDLSPVQWYLSGDPNQAHPLPLQAFLSQLLAFINAHAACKHENTLAVFGAFPGKSVMLYSSADPTPSTAPQPDANAYQPFRVVNSVLVDRITEELEGLSDAEQEEPLALVGALTKALCYINRVATSDTSDNPASVPDPRILILSVSSDQSSAYIPIMNSIFSAQKLKVAIDVCQLFGPETVFLQQAAYLTGGSYVHLTQRDALLQHLIMSFLPSSAVREILAVPRQDQVDLRASCFCHKDIVDVGYVCSVCLSIFCAPVPVCSTCRTKFPMKTLQRLNAARAAGPGTPARPSTPAARPTPSTPRQTANMLPSSNSILAGGMRKE